MRRSAPAHLDRRAVQKRFALRFLPLLAACGAAIAFSAWRERARDREVARTSARGLLALQHRMLERELEVALSTLRYLASQSTVRAFLADGEDRGAVEHDFVEFSRQSAMFDQIRILDESGDEIVRIDYEGGAPRSVPAEELQSKAERYYFQVTHELSPLEVYISPFDLNVEHGRIDYPWKPVVRLATVAPVRERRAVLVLNYLGESLLARLRQAAEPVVGWSALVSADGHFLEGPSEELSWGFMLGREPTFARRHPEAWDRIRDAQEEGVLLADSGLFAFRPFHPAQGLAAHQSDLALTLVTFTPRALLYADSARVLRVLVAVGVGAALLLGAATWQLAHGAELRATHEERLEESERHMRDLSARLLDAQEAERRNLSRDLHDELGQIATAVTIDLQRAQREPEQREALLESAVSGVGEILSGVREISSRLRTSLLDDLGLRDALVDHCSEFASRSGLSVDVQVDLDPESVPPPVAIHVYRIVQESLNNVLRHAAARTVQVQVALEDGAVHVEVVDDGAGFDVAEAGIGRLGLEGMRERVDLLAGELDIRSEPSRGTTVHARIPLDRHAAREDSGA